MQTCPHCTFVVSQISIFPMSFQDIDNVQSDASLSDFTLKRGKKKRQNSVLSDDFSDDYTEVKRSRTESMSRRMSFDDNHSSSSTNLLSQSDLNSENRTGRWTIEEIVFCDKITALFKEGKLPLKTGTKLNDFLASMLKSKPSRLTKKMKNAKLSSNLYYGIEAHIPDDAECVEFSEMEHAFFQSVSDRKERAYLKFHIRKEWRELFCAFCQEIGQSVLADAFLNSVEEMDKRASAIKNASRMIRRKQMMSQAFAQDSQAAETGVHIKTSEFDILSTGIPIVEPLKCVSAQPSNSFGHVAVGPNLNQYETDEILGLLNDDTFFDFDESNFNGLSSDKLPFAIEDINLNRGDLCFAVEENDCDVIGKSSLLHSSPFLAKVMSYMKRYHIPFEHVDVWAPTNALPGKPKDVLLEFAGCSTSDVEILSTEQGKQSPLDSEDKFNFVSFGDYSQKFIFNAGCGLPGRVFSSGTPVWKDKLLESPCHDSFHFERSGGASQWGVQTAVGIPLTSPNVGRIVVCLYSRHSRPFDKSVMTKLLDEFTKLVPTPRWKLVIDVDCPSAADFGHHKATPGPISQKPTFFDVIPKDVAEVDPDDEMLHLFDEKVSKPNTHIQDIIQLLGVELSRCVKSEVNQMDLHSLTGLRLLLLRTNRTAQEEEIATTIIGSYSSYVRTDSAVTDVAQMLARDYKFLVEMHRVSDSSDDAKACLISPVIPASGSPPSPACFVYGSSNDFFAQTPFLSAKCGLSSRDNHSVSSAKDNLSVVSN